MSFRNTNIKINLNHSEIQKELNNENLSDLLHSKALEKAEKIKRIPSQKGGNADTIYVYRGKSKKRTVWKAKQFMKWQTNIRKFYESMAKSSGGEILD